MKTLPVVTTATITAAYARAVEEAGALIKEFESEMLLIEAERALCAAEFAPVISRIEKLVPTSVAAVDSAKTSYRPLKDWSEYFADVKLPLTHILDAVLMMENLVIKLKIKDVNDYILIFGVCCCLTNKFYIDKPFDNSTWAALVKIDLKAFNEKELAILIALDYDLSPLFLPPASSSPGLGF